MSDCASKSAVMEFCQRDSSRLYDLLTQHFPSTEGQEIKHTYTGPIICAKQAKSEFKRSYLRNQHLLMVEMSAIGLGEKSAELEWKELPESEDPHKDFIQLFAKLSLKPLDRAAQKPYELFSL